MTHKLIGKTVRIYHSPDTQLPYQPLRVVDIELPFIKVAPVLEGINKSLTKAGVEHLLVEFWMPVADCKMIIEVE